MAENQVFNLVINENFKHYKNAFQNELTNNNIEIFVPNVIEDEVLISIF